MATKDLIKEIIDDFEDKLSLMKKEREEALSNFKQVIHVKKVEDIKTDLKNNESTFSKK